MLLGFCVVIGVSEELGKLASVLWGLGTHPRELGHAAAAAPP